MRVSIVAGIIGVLVVAAILGGGLFATRNNHLELKGEILKVRTYPVDPDNTIAVIDFRVTNPSTAQFQVKDVTVHMDGKDGSKVDADNFSDQDAARLFDYYKVLGPKYNQTLLTREKIDSGKTVDRMIAVRFPGTEQKVADRKDIRIDIDEVDGNSSEIIEQKH